MTTTRSHIGEMRLAGTRSIMAAHVKSSTQNAYVSDLGHRHLMPGWTRGALTLYSPYGGGGSFQPETPLSIYLSLVAIVLENSKLN